MRRIHTLVIGVVLLGALPVAAQETEEQLRARILKAWKDRQDKVKSARFVWKEVRTDAKGFLSCMQPPILPDGKKPWDGKILPPVDVTYETEVEVAFKEGEYLRYAYTAQLWSPETNKLKKLPTTIVWNNKEHRSVATRLESDYPTGTIDGVNRTSEAKNPKLRPVLHHLRGAESRLRPYDIEQFEVIPQQTIVRSRPCVELRKETRYENEITRYQLWLDKERDYVLVRELITANEAVLIKLDIDYQPNPTVNWLPHSWSYTSMHPVEKGQPLNLAKATMIDSALNESLDDTLFTIDYPVGTSVGDNRTGTTYIVKESGMRPLVGQEVYLSHAEKMALPDSTYFRGWSWLLISGSMLGLTLLATFLILRWRLSNK
jgi:hypothetical protein